MMTLPKRLLGGIAAVAAASSLVAPALAGAHAGEKTLPQTYPIAAKLCANVAAGKNRHLKRYAAQVAADCTALQSGLAAADSTVLASSAGTLAAISADRAAFLAACPAQPAKAVRCASTKRSEDRAIAALRRQQVAAARRFYLSMRSNGLRFWSEIRAFPGQSHVQADAPIAVLPS
jgi:hypothetical protein